MLASALIIQARRVLNPVVITPATAVEYRHRVPYLLAGLCFVGYSVWSIALHRAFQTTGYDLGIFEQAVRSYADGHWPVADLKASGFPLLGDHFSPILAVLAPLYLLHRSAETLLVAQALLLALSVVPVARLATDRLGARAGAMIGLAYGLSWGLLHAVRFDFHEVCFRRAVAGV